MNAAIASAIKIFATLVLGSGIFDRVLGVVERWAEKEITNKEKRDGVLNEIEIVGIKLSESLSRLAIELAVTYLKKV